MQTNLQTGESELAGGTLGDSGRFDVNLDHTDLIPLSPPPQNIPLSTVPAEPEPPFF